MSPGSVAPFFMASSYVGETPSLPMIDITCEQGGGLPRSVGWGMLYEGWCRTRRRGHHGLPASYENRGPNNERKKIYMTATTPICRHQVPEQDH